MPDDPDASDDAPEPVSRRRFLRSLGLAGLAGGSLLVAASGRSDAAPKRSLPNGAPRSAADSLDCSDLSELNEAQKKRRKKLTESLQYVTESEKDDKHCSNCQFFTPPEKTDTKESKCGACQLFPGPVHPKGYCTSWTAQTSSGG